MAEPTEPLTPEEDAALRELAAKHRRRHRWVALCSSVCVSVHTTLILDTLWNGWPLSARDLGLLAFFVVNALGGLGWLEWGEACAGTKPWSASGRCGTRAGEPSTAPGTSRGRRAASH